MKRPLSAEAQARRNQARFERDRIQKLTGLSEPEAEFIRYHHDAGFIVEDRGAYDERILEVLDGTSASGITCFDERDLAEAIAFAWSHNAQIPECRAWKPVPELVAKAEEVLGRKAWLW